MREIKWLCITELIKRIVEGKGVVRGKHKEKIKRMNGIECVIIVTVRVIIYYFLFYFLFMTYQREV